MSATTLPQYPPVFPQTDATHVGNGRGLTLRDYYAAHALSALIQKQRKWSMTDDEVALRAFDFADAMLTASRWSR